jgi:hypothetical protein
MNLREILEHIYEARVHMWSQRLDPDRCELRVSPDVMYEIRRSAGGPFGLDQFHPATLEDRFMGHVITADPTFPPNTIKLVFEVTA